jgi:hypothetical protein
MKGTKMKDVKDLTLTEVVAEVNRLNGLLKEGKATTADVTRARALKGLGQKIKGLPKERKRAVIGRLASEMATLTNGTFTLPSAAEVVKAGSFSGSTEETERQAASTLAALGAAFAVLSARFDFTEKKVETAKKK